MDLLAMLVLLLLHACPICHRIVHTPTSVSVPNTDDKHTLYHRSNAVTKVTPHLEHHCNSF